MEKIIKYIEENFPTTDSDKIENLTRLLSDMANIITFKHAKEADKLKNHPKALQEMLKISEQYIIMAAIGYETKRYDDRNKFSCKIAKDICDILSCDKEEMRNILNDDTKTNVAKQMLHEHRTIQESFAEMAFYILYKYGTESIHDKLKTAVDNKELEDVFW